VREVIDENRQEKYQWMQASFEEKLDRSITNDNLNEEQKEAILAKRNGMKESYEELKNLSSEEKCIKMQEIKEMKEEMKTWSEENGIEFGLLNGFNKGFGKGLGKGLGRGFGLKDFK